MAKSIDEIRENICQDIRDASSKEIDKIFSALKEVAKKFDRDSALKNFFDGLIGIFKSKRDKCLLFVNDIFDSAEKLSADEKKQLREALLDISNIHRAVIENIIALLEAL